MLCNALWGTPLLLEGSRMASRNTNVPLGALGWSMMFLGDGFAAGRHPLGRSESGMPLGQLRSNRDKTGFIPPS